MKHAWNKDKISIWKGINKVNIEFGTSKIGWEAHSVPLCVEIGNMVKGFKKDEEQMVEQNLDLVPLFLVNFDKLLGELGKK